ncbi:hypothetical protein [Sulfurospirillum sp. 1612]|uniref:hypothetical protein n=1 Tax=Sulfurospirillum sp. 1612 TaxID=3094835 RepID=UPI002F95196C
MYSAGDIAELEKKYSTYIKKRIIKFLLFFLVFLIIIGSLIYFFWYQKATPSTLKTQEINQTQTEKNLKEAPTTSATLPSAPKAELKSKSSQPPISTSHDKNQTKQVPAHTLSISNTPDINTTQSHAMVPPKTQENHQDAMNSDTLVLKLPTVELEPEKKVAPIVKKEKPKAKSVKVTQEVKKPVAKKEDLIKIESRPIDSITYLKDRFNENHSIIFALMLCKEYYQKKDFANTLKWSIIANDIDNTSEKSWIWFAKSKYKLGKRDDAIEALKAFLKTNNSSKIKSLLHDIINGELYD